MTLHMKNCICCFICFTDGFRLNNDKDVADEMDHKIIDDNEENEEDEIDAKRLDESVRKACN